MIPILYSAVERDFVNNGICRLGDCISCTVTEERNGIYECEFQYPITGRYYSEIREGLLISVTHDDKHDRQPFRIYRRSAPIRGVVTFNAHHISYELANVVVEPFTANNIQSALAGLETHSMTENEFSFWTDKLTVGSFTVDRPKPIREILGGSEGSILDVYGTGEYEFDKWDVKLHLHRGTDTGVSIRYGKNMIDVVHEVEDDTTYNAIIPYWTDAEGGNLVIGGMAIGEATLYSTEYWTNEDNIYIEDGRGNRVEMNYAKNRVVPMDFSSAFETKPTRQQLQQAAAAFLQNNKPWIPSENIKVDFVALNQTEEYAEYTSLQRVSLCDTVTVSYVDLGLVNVKSKVIRTVYNVLLDRYDEIELGKARTSFAQLLLGESLDLLQANTADYKNILYNAVMNATRLITGNVGGYIVTRYNAAGEPYELLIMDTPDVETAVHVWRWNLGGLGHSSNGVNGPYSTAITQDGRIVASMVTTGVLNANLLRAGIIQSFNGENYWDLESGLFQTKHGIIGDFNIYDGYLVYDNAGSGTARAIVSKDGISYAYRWSENDIGSAELYGQGLRIFWNDEEMLALYTVGDGFALTSGFTPGNLGRSVLIYSLSNHKVTSSESWDIGGNLRVTGTKNRVAETKDYGKRLLYSYESASPYFADIGEGEVGPDGSVTVLIDPIFAETIYLPSYQVFLQAYGEGSAYVSERNVSNFVVKGTPGLRFGWELKGKQLHYENCRLEEVED